MGAEAQARSTISRSSRDKDSGSSREVEDVIIITAQAGQELAGHAIIAEVEGAAAATIVEAEEVATIAVTIPRPYIKPNPPGSLPPQASTLRQ